MIIKNQSYTQNCVGVYIDADICEKHFYAFEEFHVGFCEFFILYRQKSLKQTNEK